MSRAKLHILEYSRSF